METNPLKEELLTELAERYKVTTDTMNELHNLYRKEIRLFTKAMLSLTQEDRQNLINEYKRFIQHSLSNDDLDFDFNYSDNKTYIRVFALGVNTLSLSFLKVISDAHLNEIEDQINSLSNKETDNKED